MWIPNDFLACDEWNRICWIPIKRDHVTTFLDLLHRDGGWIYYIKIRMRWMKGWRPKLLNSYRHDLFSSVNDLYLASMEFVTIITSPPDCLPLFLCVCVCCCFCLIDNEWERRHTHTKPKANIIFSQKDNISTSYHECVIGDSKPAL